jgi:uncharacterized Tic20 family protein
LGRGVGGEGYSGNEETTMTENPYARNTPYTPEEEKMWAVATHVVSIFFEGLAPLIAYIVFKDKGPFLGHHVKESLNFAITMVLVAIVLAVSVVGWLILWALPIYYVVFRIIAAVKTSQGEFYKFPLILRLIK